MVNFVMLITGIIVAFWFIGNAMGLMMVLLVTALVGFSADALVPGGRSAYGWLGAVGAGLIGSALGTLLFGQVGPYLLGVFLLPALVGTLVLAILTSFLRQRVARTWQEARQTP